MTSAAPICDHFYWHTLIACFLCLTPAPPSPPQPPPRLGLHLLESNRRLRGPTSEPAAFSQRALVIVPACTHYLSGAALIARARQSPADVHNFMSFN